MQKTEHALFSFVGRTKKKAMLLINRLVDAIYEP